MGNGLTYRDIEEVEMSIWESNSAVGQVTSEMIDQVYKWFLCLEERRLDAAYIAAVKECHGGILRCKKFVAGNGYSAKVGRFLNFCSSDFPPPEPFRPSYLDSTVDERLIWAMNITTGFENINIGEHLFPIAFVCDPDGDPNDVNPSHCDLICIDVLRDGAVLYWLSLIHI